MKSSKRQERRSRQHGCCRTKGAGGNTGFWAPSTRTNDRGANFEIPGEEVSARCSTDAQAARQRDWVSLQRTKVSQKARQREQAASTMRVWQHTTAVKARKTHGAYPDGGCRVEIIGVSQWPMRKAQQREDGRPTLPTPESAARGATSRPRHAGSKEQSDGPTTHQASASLWRDSTSSATTHPPMKQFIGGWFSFGAVRAGRQADAVGCWMQLPALRRAGGYHSQVSAPPVGERLTSGGLTRRAE